MTQNSPKGWYAVYGKYPVKFSPAGDIDSHLLVYPKDLSPPAGNKGINWSSPGVFGFPVIESSRNALIVCKDGGATLFRSYQGNAGRSAGGGRPTSLNHYFYVPDGLDVSRLDLQKCESSIKKALPQTPAGGINSVTIETLPEAIHRSANEALLGNDCFRGNVSDVKKEHLDFIEAAVKKGKVAVVPKSYLAAAQKWLSTQENGALAYDPTGEISVNQTQNPFTKEITFSAVSNFISDLPADIIVSEGCIEAFEVTKNDRMNTKRNAQDAGMKIIAAESSKAFSAMPPPPKLVEAKPTPQPPPPKPVEAKPTPQPPPRVETKPTPPPPPPPKPVEAKPTPPPPPKVETKPTPPPPPPPPPKVEVDPPSPPPKPVEVGKSASPPPPKPNESSRQESSQPTSEPTKQAFHKSKIGIGVALLTTAAGIWASVKSIFGGKSSDEPGQPPKEPESGVSKAAKVALSLALLGGGIWLGHHAMTVPRMEGQGVMDWLKNKPPTSPSR